MTKQKQSALSNTKIAIVFFAILLFFVALSVLFKLILVLRAGQFDDSRRFVMSVADNKNHKAMSFSGSTKDIAVFKLDANVKQDEIGQFLGVPIDAFITSKSLDLSEDNSSLFSKAIFNYKSIQTNLTLIDLTKLFFFTISIPERSIIVKNVPGNLTPAELDKIIGRSVRDEFIEKDKQTIQIINGTDVVGLGNKMARLLTNIGGDVIIVATSDKLYKKSKIQYIDKKTYTVERLSKILGFEAEKAGNNLISDIAIIIGEDNK